MNALPVDIDHLRNLSGDDPHEMQKLSQLYVRTVTAQLKELTQAIEDKQCKTVAQIAHSAVGASAVIGMKAVIPSLKEMEKLGIARDLRRGPDVLLDIRTAFSHICTVLDAHRLLSKSSRRLESVPALE